MKRLKTAIINNIVIVTFPLWCIPWAICELWFSDSMWDVVTGKVSVFE